MFGTRLIDHPTLWARDACLVCVRKYIYACVCICVYMCVLMFATYFQMDGQWKHVCVFATNRESYPQSLKRGKEKAPSITYSLSGWITAVSQNFKGRMRGRRASSNMLLERSFSISKCSWWELRYRGSHQEDIHVPKDKGENPKDLMEMLVGNLGTGVREKGWCQQ